MELISKEVLELEKRCDRYIIIKDRDKQGSAVIGFNESQDLEFRETLAKCEIMAQLPLQVIRLGGKRCLEIYGEYAPYTIVNSVQEILDIVRTGNCPGRPHPLLQVRKQELGY